MTHILYRQSTDQKRSMVKNWEEIPRFFGRRKGHTLSTIKHQLAQTVLPHLIIDRHNRDTILKSWPRAGHSVWMEIGFGSGEHLLHRLTADTNACYLGAEAFMNGVLTLAGKVSPQDYPRLRICPDNVHSLLPFLPSHLFDGIYILFPDPWPKARHEKRRLIQQPFLEKIWSLLKPQGTLIIASDVPSLVTFMIGQLEKSPFFTWKDGVLPEKTDPHLWPEWPASMPLTRYATKALSMGRKNAYMCWTAHHSFKGNIPIASFSGGHT